MAEMVYQFPYAANHVEEGSTASQSSTRQNAAGFVDNAVDLGRLAMDWNVMNAIGL